MSMETEGAARAAKRAAFKESARGRGNAGRTGNMGNAGRTGNTGNVGNNGNNGRTVGTGKAEGRNVFFRDEVPLGLASQSMMLKLLRSQVSVVVSLLSLTAVTLMSVGVVFFKNTEPRLEPYVVTVDRQGVVLNNGLMKRAESVTESMVLSQMQDFIRNMYMVTSDRKVQESAVQRVYSFLIPDSEVWQQVSDFYNTHNPFEMKSGEISVIIKGVGMTRAKEVIVDWEQHSEKDGVSLTREKRAIILFRLADRVPDYETSVLNPLGICITGFTVFDLMTANRSADGPVGS